MKQVDLGSFASQRTNRAGATSGESFNKTRRADRGRRSTAYFAFAVFGVLLCAYQAQALTLTNGSLSVDILSGNGAINTVTFGGSDFYRQGTFISDWGLQSGTDTSSFRINTTYGGAGQAVSVTTGPGTVIVSGTFTAGGANLAFTRTYSLVAGYNVLRIRTDFTNNGPDMTVSYFDTFDPDQGQSLGFGFGTYNDAFALGSAFVGQAYASNDLTVVMGSTDPAVTVAAGNPFNIGDGFALNAFFSSPFDGNGGFADSGTHVGFRFPLLSGASRTVVYDQAYGTTHSAAQSTFTSAQTCGNGSPDAGESCDEGSANGSSTSCCTTACTYRTAGQTCRPSAGVCDLADTCTGSSGACPADAKSTSECRASNGVCDPAESCDGSTDNCPADTKQPSTYVCRGAAGVCDVDELCDGSTDNCPSDSKQPSTHTCRASVGVCDLDEMCDGSTNDCPSDAKSSAPCRASNGVCDPAESCNGVDDNCPTDAKSTSLCRAAAGVCDVDDFCDGANDACPIDAKQPGSHTCRASVGVCDLTELCDGATNDCPADAKSTALCRGAAGVCDVDDFCNGTNDNCPADAKQPSTHTCRGAAGVCDVAESCDGSTDNCPADTKQPSTHTCRASGGVCDVAELCDGSTDNCPTDTKQPSTHTCRGAAGVCDVAELCDGSTNNCPADAKQPSTHTCRGAVDVCDAAESCDGSTDNCPGDAKKPSGTLCRGLADECDIVEVCNGSADTCPGDVVKADDVPCFGPNNNTCLNTCQGGFCTADFISNCCGNGTLESAELCDDGNQANADGCSDHCGLDVENFQCYRSTRQTQPAVTMPLTLVDQFNSSVMPPVNAEVRRPEDICNPASINGQHPGAPSEPDHLQAYKIAVRPRRDVSALFPERNVKLVNQFGTIFLDVTWPFRLLVPTAKSLTAEPPAPVAPDVDHFTCYKVKRPKGQPRFTPITNQVMTDQFGTRTVTLIKPSRLCLPTNKNNEEPGAENNIGHLLCYRVRPKDFDQPGTVYINNQFGGGTLVPKVLSELCVPSVKNPN